MTEHATTSQNPTRGTMVFVALAVALQGLFIAALALQDGYSQSGLTYASRTDFGVMAKLLSRASLPTIISRAGVLEFGFLAVTTASIILAIATRRSRESGVRAAVLLGQCVLFFPGWLFLVALIFDIQAVATGTLDGEWLGETFPPLEVLGLWLLLCACSGITSSPRLMSWLRRLRIRKPASLAHAR